MCSKNDFLRVHREVWYTVLRDSREETIHYAALDGCSVEVFPQNYVSLNRDRSREVPDFGRPLILRVKAHNLDEMGRCSKLQTI